MSNMKGLAKKLHSLGYFVDGTGEFVRIVMADKTPVDMATINSLHLRKFIKTHEHNRRLDKMKPFNVKR